MMKASHTFPTSYGVSVPVCSTDDGEFHFSMESTAFVLGIHDPKQRAGFVADATAYGRVDTSRLAEYGGGPVPRVSIPRPKESAYLQIPSGMDGIPIEKWVDLVMDQTRWCDRAEALLDIVGSNIDNVANFEASKTFEPIMALALQIMITGCLEHLAEQEIDCLEAASFYALSVHAEWSTPAVRWLKPMRATWFKDWIATRPAYRHFAMLCQKDGDLPRWIAGGSA